MPYRKILADNLTRYRKLSKTTQAEVSALSAVSIETISLIERECANVTLDILERLAAYTGLTVPELLTENFVNDMIVGRSESDNEK